MNMTRFAFLLPLVFAASSIVAQDVAVEGIDILGFGIFGYEQVVREKSPTSPTGYRTVGSGVTLAEQTSRIPLRPGIAYGIKFRVRGTPATASVPIKLITSRSRGCLKESGESIQRSEQLRTVLPNQDAHMGSRQWDPADLTPRGCLNDEEPGDTVTMELIFEDRVIKRVTFERVKE